MILDFAALRRLVVSGERVYTVRRPSVAAVLVAGELFAEEISTLRSAIEQQPALLAAEVRTLVESIVREGRDPRLSLLLPLLANGPGPAEQWPAVEILAVALEQCNVQRIAETLVLSHPAAAEASEPEPPTLAQLARLDVLTEGLLRIADRFRLDPVAVMEWPFEALLTAAEWIEANPPVVEQPPSTSLPSPEIPGHTLRVAHG